VPPGQVADDQRGSLDVDAPVYDSARQRSVFVRNGDVFLRDLRSGALTQLTRSSEKASAVNFARDGGVICAAPTRPAPRPRSTWATSWPSQRPRICRRTAAGCWSSPAEGRCDKGRVGKMPRT
jgi:hypothetical protein